MKKRTLTKAEKDAIIKRRGYKSAKDGEKHKRKTLVIHHTDRKINKKDLTRLKVLTKTEHIALHQRMGYK